VSSLHYARNRPELDQAPAHRRLLRHGSGLRHRLAPLDLLGQIDDLFDPSPDALRAPDSGSGLPTAVGIIFVVGTIATNVVGRRVLALADKLLMRVPVYRRLYPSVKQLIESFSPEKRSSFKEVVLAEHPRKGSGRSVSSRASSSSTDRTASATW